MGGFAGVTATFDGLAAIGKILMCSGVVSLSTTNVSKYALGADSESEATSDEVTEFTSKSKMYPSGSKNLCSYIDEMSTVSLTILVMSEMVVCASLGSE